MSAPTLGSMPLDDQTRRELFVAAAKVRVWTEKRNALIRAAFEAGGGVREIAKATGLNVGTVHTMLHGRNLMTEPTVPYDYGDGALRPNSTQPSNCPCGHTLRCDCWAIANDH